MQSNRTEVAEAEAPAVVGYRKLNLFYRRHSALGFIHRVIVSFIRQRVHLVQLFCCQSIRRRVLHKHHRAVALKDGLAVNLVLLVVLYAAGFGIHLFGPANHLIGWALHPAVWGLDRRAEVAGAPNISDRMNVLAGFKPVCKLDNAIFAHSEH